MSAPAVEVRHLTKRFRVYRERNQTIKQALLRGRRAVYDDFTAVDDVSFTIPSGSTFGIIGSNGSGKSTTLKVLAQILEPDSGSVVVRGRMSALLELGAGFHPELSGRENVFLNAAILGIPKRHIEARFHDIVEFAGLGGFIDNPVKTYSSGMFARLGFAVAVNVDPEVLLIDEVLAVGDETFQRRCSEKISELRSGGRTVVIVSHSLATVQSLCEQAVWIEKGKLAALGDPTEVIDAYLRSVHPEALVDESGQVHYGSGPARVRAIELSGDDESLICGEPASVTVHLESADALDSLVLAVSIRRTDGVHAATLSTRHDLSMRALPAGRTVLRFRTSRLPLQPGSYEVGATLSDPTRQLLIDRVDHAGRFDVAPSPTSELDGSLVSVAGTWDRS